MRLYKKIYLAIVVSLLAVVLIAAIGGRIGWRNSPAHQSMEMLADLVAAALPEANEPAGVQQQAIRRLAGKLDTDLALYDERLRLIAEAGDPLPVPRRRQETGWLPSPRGAAWGIALSDGRMLVVRAPIRFRFPVLGIVLFLGSIALAVALCAYPFVRGITRRLERLQEGVETLGAGDLSARVPVKGRDEIAQLAGSFNRAAGRIEELVGAHRMLLANASHELRTPLSRIRLGIELMQRRDDPKYRRDLERDVAELDELVDEILLTSRLDAAPQLHIEEVDLLALAAEEAARHEGCDVSGEPITLKGDARLLRRVIRNLLGNAERYGKPPVIVTVARDGAAAVLTVADSGPGIPEAERERVFTPFHRLDASSRGAGLGLALVRQIARAHGGDVRIVTHPNAASAFRVILPVR